MADLNKFYKRWNQSLNNGAGGWEKVYFKTTWDNILDKPTLSINNGIITIGSNSITPLTSVGSVNGQSSGLAPATPANDPVDGSVFVLGSDGAGGSAYWFDGASKFALEGHTHGYYTKPSGGIPASDLAQSYVSYSTEQSLNETQMGRARNNIGAGTSNLTIGTTSSTAAAGNHNHDNTYLKTTLKGAASGLAELDANGKVPSSQLPSYVDDVLEYTSSSNFPATGETGKIYVATGTNLTYRWTGSTYVEISPSLALGTTSSTAFRGDYGNTAYSHATLSGTVGANTSGFYKITTDKYGHVTDVEAVVKSDITALGIPGSDTNTWRGMQNNLTTSSSSTSDSLSAYQGYLLANGSARDNTKLPKVTYEWNKEISFGNSGYLLIGKFPMYDSNITIDIDSTTSTTYHATLVIATQNINTSKGGSAVCNVYGDADNSVTGSFRVQYSSGSNKFNVYFAPQSWSKNLIHIRAVALAASPTESEICTNVNSLPTTDLLTINNLLTANFAAASHTHSYLPLSGGTLNKTDSDTPLYLQGNSGSTYLGFKNSSGTVLGYYYVNASNKPGFYYNGTGTEISLVGHTHSQYLTSHQDISGKADKASITAGWYRRVYVNSQGIVTNADQTDDNTTYNFSGTTFYSGNSSTAEHNANSAVKNGNYYYTSNGPSSLGESSTDGALYVQSHSDNWVGQIAQDYRNGRLWVRGKNDGTWSNWKRIAQYDEIPTNTNQLTNGAGFITSSGSCAYATSAGSAASATTASTAATASALGVTEAVGSSTQPVYINSSGVPVACSYTIAKSVPSNADFTNTWRPVSGTGSSSDAAKADHNHDSTYLKTAVTKLGTRTGDITIATLKSDLGLGSNAYTSTNIPTQYITSASVSESTLTLTPASGNAVTFTNTWRSLGTGASDACAGNDSRLSNARTPTAHASSSTTYGVGTTSNYGHVKLVIGDLYNNNSGDGYAAGANHTHSQYMTTSSAIERLQYTTTVPSSANASGLKIYIGSTNPSTKYSGWLYIITS